MQDHDLEATNQPKQESEVGRLPPKREPIFNRTPIGVAVLIGAILAVHLFLMFLGEAQTQLLNSQLGVVPLREMAALSSGHLATALVPLIISQFLHGGTLHLVMNMAMLLQCGPIAEMGFGNGKGAIIRLVCFFLICGIGGGVAYCLINPNSDVPTIGASGSISGVFAGFLWAAIGLAKPGQSMLRPVLSSAAVFLLINVGLAWVGRATGFLPIAWESHLGGFVAGLIFYPLIARLGRGQS